jgi:hypothetical protein
MRRRQDEIRAKGMSFSPPVRDESPAATMSPELDFSKIRIGL